MRVLLDIVRQSLATLWAHKLRFILLTHVRNCLGRSWDPCCCWWDWGEGFRSGQEKKHG